MHRALGAQTVQEMDHVRVVQRLTRVVKIMKLLLAQFEVLETMTPMGACASLPPRAHAGAWVRYLGCC